MTQTDKMLARKDGGVGIVTFNNPERHNAVSLEMWSAAKEILDRFAADDEVRAVVLTGAGVPCGRIYAIDEMFADPQVRHLDVASTVKRGRKPPIKLLRQPVKLSRTRSRMAAPPPELGQHTNAVLREFGFSPRAIAALRKAGAV